LLYGKSIFSILGPFLNYNHTQHKLLASPEQHKRTISKGKMTRLKGQITHLKGELSDL